MNDAQAAIAEAAERLGRGELVCFPTETTYGLAADLRAPGALARLVALKGRDPRAPFAMIAHDAQAARTLARVWPDAAQALAVRHWPGALTLVVPARADLPAEVVGPGGGVGVRVSPHPVAHALAAALGAPITATSANPSGSPPALDVNTARGYFGDRVSMYLDGGPAAASTASTVVAVAEDGSLTVIRPGVVDIST